MHSRGLGGLLTAALLALLPAAGVRAGAPAPDTCAGQQAEAAGPAALDLVSPRQTTIAAIAALTAPSAQPVRVDALLVSADLEDDGGIRLRLADPFDTARTVNAELPDPAPCASESTTGPSSEQSWDAFVAAFGTPARGVDTALWRYATLSALESADATDGSAVQLAPVVDFQLTSLAVPVHAADLTPAIAAYRADVSQGLAELAAQTADLDQAVDAGRIDDAQRLWLPAHLTYERLGAAYDSFGDFDTRINGRPDGLPCSVDDPDFTGFLRLEYGLWNGQTAAELQPVADQLVDDVGALVAAFPTDEIDPAELPLRAHEILENALQFELTGDTDQGSHTALATVRANIDGTETVLNTLQPLLEPRRPELWLTIQSSLDGLAGELDGLTDSDGAWLPLDQLSRGQRELLDGSLGQLLEQLAVVPDALEIVPGP
jgi:iron uptake system EfeUOB component EfeO/EfeM